MEVFAVEDVRTPGFEVRASEQDGVVVHRLHYDLADGDAFRNTYDHPRIGDACRRVIDAHRPDVVHVVSGYLLGSPVLRAARDMGVPVVITLTEFWFLCARLNLLRRTGALCDGPDGDMRCARCLMEDQRRYRLPAVLAPAVADLFWVLGGHLPAAKRTARAVHDRQKALRSALEAADMVICPSRYLLRTFERFGFDTTRFVFMRQGIAKPTGELPARPRPRDTMRIGYVGQLKPHKGVDLLVDAVVGLLDAGFPVTLDVWGSETEDPDHVRALKRRSLGRDAIRWNGRYIGSQVWTVLGGMDVLVVPSRWHENSPNAILEAYAMGIPVVVTSLGGMAELVEPGTTGLTFALDDAVDLRHQLTRLLTEPGLLDKLRASLPAVKGIDDEMDELVKAYSRLVPALG